MIIFVARAWKKIIKKNSNLFPIAIVKLAQVQNYLGCIILLSYLKQCYCVVVLMKFIYSQQ